MAVGRGRAPVDSENERQSISDTARSHQGIKDPRAVEPILARIKEDGFQVEDALKELGAVAEPALIERLTNPDKEIRRRACVILKEVGGRETLKAMQSLPADSEFSVRVAAQDAMRNIAARVGPLPVSERKGKAVGSTSRRRVPD